MKKALFTIGLLLNLAIVYAFDTNTNFGIKKQDSADKYQQYVGKVFFVRQAYGEHEKWEKTGFKYNPTYEGKTFTISSITVEDVVFNGTPNKEITFISIENGGKTKIKIRGYEDFSFYSDMTIRPLIERIPIVFVEPFNKYKQELIGETITHDMVKDQYEVVDASIGPDKIAATPYVTVKNKRTGETISCRYSEINTAPFESALTGSYKTALVQVEKPEDVNNRYGETKTIQDEGIDKYSYNDNIIDITIFGTKEEFSFVLKNISQNSLKIIWNEAVFVGLDGSTSKIMHVGTKYSQREGDQPASVIIKGAKIEDVATPTANVYYDEGIRIGYSTIGSGWKTKPMIPKEYIGKDAGELRLMLPIQVKDVINEYTFVFRVYYAYDHPELLNADKL